MSALSNQHTTFIVDPGFFASVAFDRSTGCYHNPLTDTWFRVDGPLAAQVDGVPVPLDSRRRSHDELYPKR